MPFDVLNPWMLVGLAGVAIPLIIHLLNRRRFEVVDWGAMQFLQVSEVTRRRLLLEELLLMLLRMALIAGLVVGLAAPFATSAALQRLAGRPNRDVVLVIDGSYSMSALGTGVSPHDAAKEWALAFVNDLIAGDGVAVLQAKQQVVPVVGRVSHDLARVREKIAELPPPGGGCDWPGAVQAAHALLADSQAPEREIILLSDGQRYGWADPTALLRWEMLATQLGFARPDAGAAPRPHVWAVNLDPERSPDLPNWSLGPLQCSRPVVPAGREVTFRTELELHNQAAYAPPYKIRLEVDGRPVRDLEAPRGVPENKGKVPLSFTHRFAVAGSHLVTVLLEPDPPPEERPPGYALKDRVPGDNRQDFAVDVVQALPVLLVDGDPSPAPRGRATDFLRDALSPARDPNPVVQARVVTLADFAPAQLTGADEPGRPREEVGWKPRVLILVNVPRLSAAQQEAVEQFLADGGGVLVTLGDRAEADGYNGPLYRDGKGWLPARLEGVEGGAGRPEDAVRPAVAASTHPALELFRSMPNGGGLGDARFPRWWKLGTPGRHAAGVTVAVLRSAAGDYPFLVERGYQAGRVLLCSVPLDNSWGTNLPDLPAFVPLAHELVYYLAGARSAEFNVQPGQPLRYRMETEAGPEGFTLEPPLGDARPLSAAPNEHGTYPAQVTRLPRGALLLHEGTRETGVYRLRTPDRRTVYYVVQPDARESDLTPCSDEDREKVADLFNPLKLEGDRRPLRYENDRGQILATLATTSQRQELWWWFLLGVVGLLCAEVWMTRRMVKNR
jgi:hypothetical protein